MPVLPTFDPQGRPGEAVQAGMDARSQSESWMDSATRRRMEEQQMAQSQETFDAMRPVRIEQAKAKLSELHNQVAGDVQMNQLTSAANLEMPRIRQSWIDASKIDDPGARLRAQDQVLGVADKYTALKGVGDEIKQWHNVYAEQAVNARTRDTVAGRTEVAQMKAQMDQQIAQSKNESAIAIAQAKAEAAAALAEQKRQHDEEMIQLRGNNRVESSSRVLQNQGAYKENQGIIDAGRNAMATTQSLKRGLALMSDPDIRTGTGAVFENKIKRLGQLLGFDAGSVSTFEQLQPILGDFVLSRVQQTKGSISDKEMQSFQNYSASPDKSPEGNIGIMKALLAVKEREVQIAKMVNDARRRGEAEADIQGEINDFILTNDISGLIPGSKTEGAAPVVPTWTPQKESRLQELKAKLGK